MARSLWQRLPRRWRRGLVDLARHLVPLPKARGAAARPPIYVAGLLSSTVGMGEGARLCLTALEKLGHRPVAIDLAPLFRRQELAARPAVRLPEGPGTLILHLNGDMTALGLALLGRRGVAGKRVIGYWAWELPRIPRHWQAALAFVDEVWAPSRFTAEAIRPFTGKPVRIVPHPVAARRRGTRRRARFGLAEGRFVVLAAFHMSSSFARKNPLAAIAAFRAAFGGADDALLLIKVSEGASQPAALAALRAAAAGVNVRLYEETLSEDEMRDLVASVDAVLSLHRAEGFGLLLAEALRAGVPAVATGWSGNLDFMQGAPLAHLVGHRLVPVVDPQGCYDADGQLWAEPDVDEAARLLRNVRGSRPPGR